MSEPLVVCVMLTRDRHAMAMRAVEAFRAQTYANRRLLIYNTGGPPLNTFCQHVHERIATRRCNPDGSECGPFERETIGELRNFANQTRLATEADILIHWDDDDLSHPNRISEQVALLQSSGKECVGYREVLFWDSRPAVWKLERNDPSGYPAAGGFVNEAWLYSNRDSRYCIGASLCYWRRVWERRPFEALPKNREGLTEDNAWLRGVDSLGISSMAELPADLRSEYRQEVATEIKRFQPRLICSIHGANSQPYDIEATIARGATEWRRVPEWDGFCRDFMSFPGGEPTQGATSEREADATIRPVLPGEAK
jgi:hypothetical protein